MQVIHLIDRFSAQLDEVTGGSRINLYRLLPALSAQGIRQEVWTADGPGEETAIPIEGGEDILLRRLTRDARYRRRFEQTWHDARLVDEFAALMGDHKPGLVHFHSLAGLSLRLPAIAARSGARSVIHFHDYSAICPQNQLLPSWWRQVTGTGPCARIIGMRCAQCVQPQFKGLRRPGPVQIARALNPFAGTKLIRQMHGALGESLEAAQAVIAPSADTKAMLLRYGIPEEKIAIVPYGIEGSEETDRHRHDPLRFAMLGALAPWKGTHLAVEASRLLEKRPHELHLYGSAEDAGYLSEIRRAMQGLPVTIHEHVSHEGMRYILDDIDVLLVPSLWPETYHIALHEAADRGIPAIVSDLGAHGEAVEDGVSGWKVPTGDARALATKMAELIDDPSQLEQVDARRIERVGLAEQARLLAGVYVRTD